GVACAGPPAVGEAHLLELLDLLHEPEGPRRRDLAPEGLQAGEAEIEFLSADGRRIVERVVHREAVTRLDGDPFLAGFARTDGIGTVDDDLLQRARLIDHPPPPAC